MYRINFTNFFTGLVWFGLIILAMCVPAFAGNPGTPYDRPPVIEPECRHFGLIPCHTFFDYDEPEGDEPRVSTPTPTRDPEPSPPTPPSPNICR